MYYGEIVEGPAEQIFEIPKRYLKEYSVAIKALNPPGGGLLRASIVGALICWWVNV